MFYDTKHNTLETVTSNLDKAFVETAEKMWAYWRCLPARQRPGDGLIMRKPPSLQLFSHPAHAVPRDCSQSRRRRHHPPHQQGQTGEIPGVRLCHREDAGYMVRSKALWVPPVHPTKLLADPNERAQAGLGGCEEGPI
ncbi:hypothetical protein LY76DRAFT_51196 [Colletotrichum caudatum]|nr:hypothetical protein LY76DRAFT_51196 [Colletotrichum caudatum]